MPPLQIELVQQLQHAIGRRRSQLRRIHLDGERDDAGGLVYLGLGCLSEATSTELETLLQVFPIYLEQIEQLPLGGGRAARFRELGLQRGPQHFAAVQQPGEKFRRGAAGHGVAEAELTRQAGQSYEAARES